MTEWKQKLDDLNVKIFADTADLDEITRLAKEPYIKGITTNPTLMCRAGVLNYEVFARAVVACTNGLPVSFEILDDAQIEQQARVIAGWGENVYVKVPIVTPSGVFNLGVIRNLSRDGIKINVTAVCSLDQMSNAVTALSYKDIPAIISVFAGRIADTGCNPSATMHNAALILYECSNPNIQLLWASTRQVLDIFSANDAGCNIITVPPPIIAKLPLIGTDLEQRSIDTVAQFNRDAAEVGYSL